MQESFKIPSATFPTLTGSIVTFNAQYALPLKSHKIALTATQSGSGTPSPSNPRPISGYSAINISHSDADTSNPTVYTIQIGSTVYGGEYDARSGVLTVTHGICDLGSVTEWGYISSGNRFTSGYLASVIKRPITDSEVADIIADIFDTKSVTALRSSADDNLIAVGDSGVISIRCTTYGTDANAFKTAMSGHYIVYELTTPQTIQLPPCPIDTLEGVNNIWADTGDTTLQYPKFG